MTLNDLEVECQSCNRNCIGCNASSVAGRFYFEKNLRNLRPIFSLVNNDCNWRDDHVQRLLY